MPDSTQSRMRDTPVGSPTQPCPHPRVKFKNIDEETKQALEEFEKASKPGDRGYSVKNLKIANRTASEIDRELAGEGGWKKDPETGKLVSSDGQWTKTEKLTTQNPDGTPCTPYRQVFYENRDGGVVRVKPDGMPDARFAHMKKPHACKYVKKDPAGDTSFENEAFKVNGGNPIPKTPAQIEFPPGIQPGTPEAEDYIAKCWRTPSHQPLKAEAGEQRT